ncbi:MAG: 50S ribosomal protein L15 [Candidatus Dojkabacteria bacterium]|nr:50S ribosomal protein L15 [Candidatus Dojkabacteria bacterium]
MSLLNNLVSPKSTKKSKKLGRGIGSGVGGHTVGRGGKGATARSGFKYPTPGFEGGQMPLSRRLPKLRGEADGLTRKHFTKNISKCIVKLSHIEKKMLEAGYTGKIDANTLVDFGLFKPKFNKVSILKILYDRDVNVPMYLVGLKVSKKARSAIEKVGGTVEE